MQEMVVVQAVPVVQQLAGMGQAVVVQADTQELEVPEAL
jgi:hypothetical protein